MPLAVGEKDRVMGPSVLEATLGGPDAPRSNCSQQYVRASPFASVAEPMSSYGVEIGMVRLVGEDMEREGAVLPVAVPVPQVLPLPVCVNDMISS